MKPNYQKILDQKLTEIKASGTVPSLLLHSCCAPCSSYVLEYLSEYFEITVFYYNPNIEPASEYRKRVEEQKRLISTAIYNHSVHFIEGQYDPDHYHEVIRGYETAPEGGDRCIRCFNLRLGETARIAAEGGFDYFTTTLTISPHKNADNLNRIGTEISDIYKVEYLISDFKKRDGYKRSIELSKQYNLYRQDYCGCIYSKKNQ